MKKSRWGVYDIENTPYIWKLNNSEFKFTTPTKYKKFKNEMEMLLTKLEIKFKIEFEPQQRENLLEILAKNFYGENEK